MILLLNFIHTFKKKNLKHEIHLTSYDTNFLITLIWYNQTSNTNYLKWGCTEREAEKKGKKKEIQLVHYRLNFVSLTTPLFLCSFLVFLYTQKWKYQYTKFMQQNSKYKVNHHFDISFTYIFLVMFNF